MSTVQLVLFIVGLGLLIVGAELLVRGASRLAVALGLSPLVVGLTVVAYGTSSPEMAVSAMAALRGQTDLALGNVVGSNIFNVLFILGLSALIVPLLVARQVVWREVPIMIAVSLAMLLLGLDGSISRLDGLLLLGGAVFYTVWTVRASRREAAAARSEGISEPPPRRTFLALNVLFILVGLGMLLLGSRWLVGGAVAMARALGVNELIIGLTIIAAGTSLPEVATSILAAARGERDIAVGNVVGSNIFNILIVLGLGAAASPTGVAVSPAALSFDIPVMLAVAFACFPIFISGHVISRWEGAVFFGYYIAYTVYLVLDAQQHDALHGFSRVMVWFVLPLTALTLLVILARSTRLRPPR
jgi:cation:H+ antiporter